MSAARSIRILLSVAGLALSSATILSPSTAIAQATPVVSKQAGKGEQSLPIRRIVLYRSGVGAFERRGMIDGHADMQLRFSTDQVNDILKSMFVLDKGGTVEGIRYGSKDPLSRRLASFGIDISDNPSAGELLSRLRGTPVRITSPEGPVTGTVMNVETRPTVYTGGDKGSATKFDLPWINLLTDSGVRSFNLTAVTGFEVLDPMLAKELSKALAALAEHKADRTKTVDVSVNGNGSREVIVGYIHEMPVWKTSYRLILGDSPKGDQAVKPADATMQGWAMVENTTDEDWNNVSLSLVSGRPVSFRMDLYEPLYVYRPELPVPTVPGVMPRAYEGGDLAFADKDTVLKEAAGRMNSRGRLAGNSNALAKAAEPAGRGDAGRSMQMDRSEVQAPMLSSDDLTSYSARTQAKGVEAGEVFQYQLESPVTLERQKSAMLPILSSPIPSRRVSIYNRTDGSKNPMRGVEITNATTLQFIPGPISVYDGAAYAGDAQIGHVGAGDKRLLAYSVDLEVEARAEDNGNSEVRKIRIIDGTFEQTIKNVNSTKYTFTNKDQARTRTIIVEHPKLGGWDLVEPKKPTEKTEAMYRFELEVAGGKQGEMRVTQEQITLQRVGIADLQFNYLLDQSKAGKVSQAVIDAVREVAKRQGAINDVNSKVQRLESERAEIDKDQARIRENMKTVGQQAQVYARYLQKFTEQESRIEQIDTDAKTARADAVRLQNDLNEFVRKLNVE